MLPRLPSTVAIKFRSASKPVSRSGKRLLEFQSRSRHWPNHSRFYVYHFSAGVTFLSVKRETSVFRELFASGLHSICVKYREMSLHMALIPKDFYHNFTKRSSIHRRLDRSLRTFVKRTLISTISEDRARYLSLCASSLSLSALEEDRGNRSEPSPGRGNKMTRRKGRARNTRREKTGVRQGAAAGYDREEIRGQI